jgi:hypothetical protein
MEMMTRKMPWEAAFYDIFEVIERKLDRSDTRR